MLNTKKVKPMHDNELIEQFVELRVQGLSVPKIAEKLGVPAPTLYRWNERARQRIHKLRLLAVEQAEDHILGTQQAQCEALARHLKAVDEQIATEVADGVEQFALPQLIRMAASLRQQLYRLKLHLAHPLIEDDAGPAPAETGSTPPTTQTDTENDKNDNFR